MPRDCREERKPFSSRPSDRIINAVQYTNPNLPALRRLDFFFDEKNKTVLITYLDYFTAPDSIDCSYGQVPQNPYPWKEGPA